MPFPDNNTLRPFSPVDPVLPSADRLVEGRGHLPVPLRHRQHPARCVEPCGSSPPVTFTLPFQTSSGESSAYSFDSIEPSVVNRNPSESLSPTDLSTANTSNEVSIPPGTNGPAENTVRPSQLTSATLSPAVGPEHIIGAIPRSTEGHPLGLRTWLVYEIPNAQRGIGTGDVVRIHNPTKPAAKLSYFIRDFFSILSDRVLFWATPARDHALPPIILVVRPAHARLSARERLMARVWLYRRGSCLPYRALFPVPVDSVTVRPATPPQSEPALPTS
ncbi:hypothetical protein BC835DRAFT_1410023 [Cytidiella melzeri]|nr:hypothetical protein BC835DRAFT_1410023 [Cytidiella melzeri]